MSKHIRRTLGFVLVLALILAQVLIPLPVQKVNAAVQTQASVDNNADEIQSGVTLHCWNWSFKNIEANMQAIKDAGYTAIQTSPIQQAKQATAGFPVNDWWVYYQPADFKIDNTGNSALGNKADFESMCATAHKYGIKVIVDVVANHMADNGGNNISPSVNADIRNDSSCWHDISKNIDNYYDRYNITQYCLDKVPDLNTSNKKVQNYVLNYLKECIDAGADGFRFDAQKHIETPDDPYCASDFWPTIVNGAEEYAATTRGLDLYCYGELLFNPDEGGSLPVSAYTKYMPVTDNSWSNTVRNNVINGGNAGAFSGFYHKDASANQLVLWAESHDNYAGDGSKNISSFNINKTWALAAARADAMSLYLARPENTYPQLLGAASLNTGWQNEEVKQVNLFHNYFDGQNEYVANENGVAYVERGTAGVVLVKASGGSGAVSVTANQMAPGTYQDQITGNTFTVSNGKISGNVGSSGIAVVYNAVPLCEHPSHTIDGICTSCNATIRHTYGADGYCACGAAKPADRNIYFANSANWSEVNIYSWANTTTFTSAWPGDAMTEVGDGIYSYTFDGEVFDNPTVNVIFNNSDAQTDDLVIPADKNLYDFATGIWSSYAECEHPSHGTDGICTSCGNRTPHTFLNSKCTVCGLVCVHMWSNGVCTVCRTTCDHESHDLSGVCGTCGAAVEHSYGSDGKCACGVEKAAAKVVYFNNTGSWTKVNIYAWSDASGSTVQHSGAWPGTAMTYVGNNIYSFELPIDAEKVIFNNGSAQTDDLAIPAEQNQYNYSNGTWTAYTPPCTHPSHDLNGICTNCGESVAHSYVNGLCACGAENPASTYYLFGSINGADYGTGDDYETLGQYKFVGGKLTATFAEDSYIGIKTGDNYTWYMTDGWAGEVTSVTMYNTAILDETADKLYVPGGVELTFTLVNNSDGSLTLSYVVAEDPIIVPTLTPVLPSMALEEEVKYNIYFTATDLGDLTVNDMGLAVFESKVEDGTVDNAYDVIPGAIKSSNYYMVQSNGIPAKRMGDSLYFRIYVKLSDGSYAYSKIFTFNAISYVKSVLNNTSYPDGLKQTCVALMNYGANAQVYFGYKTDSLMNSFLTAEQQALVSEYSSSMIGAIAKADATKIGEFAVTPGGYTSRIPSVSLEGAFAINYYFKAANAVEGDMTFYYWDKETYDSVSVLTKENAQGVKIMDSNGSEYWASFDGIAAKELDETVYVAAVYESGGVTYSTGVLAVSITALCASQMGSNAALTALTQAIVVYGNYAESYFANI